MKTSIAIFTLAFGWFTGQAWAIETHCTDDEKMIFNCSTGKKVVSVCAAKNLSANAGYLQYRFGKPGAVELILPATKTPPNADMQADTMTFSGGGGAYIRFNSNQHSYVVYTAIGKGWGEKAGVAVEVAHKLQANLSCKNEPISELGADFFAQAGLVTDTAGFDLP